MVYKQSKRDYNIFVRHVNGLVVIALLYVDEQLLTSDDVATVLNTKTEHHKAFTIKVLGLARFFLGFEIARSESGKVINQREFLLDILANVNMLDCKTASFSLPRGLRLSINNAFFHGFIEEKLYMVPLEGYLLASLGQAYILQGYFYKQSTQDYSFFVRHVNGLVAIALVYVDDQLLTSDDVATILNTKTDKDLGLARFFLGLEIASSESGDIINQRKFLIDILTNVNMFSTRSVSGHCLFHGSFLVSFSVESEYKSMSYTTSEVVWLYGLLKDLHIPLVMPIPLYFDNKMSNILLPILTKHLNIDCHYVRGKVSEGFLKTIHVKSQLQLIDRMTKPLGEVQHKLLVSKLGLAESLSSLA
ncbi:hypothetical protein V2J09_010757 [Rumex salicifolius]